jgi:hypothetical protein
MTTYTFDSNVNPITKRTSDIGRSKKIFTTMTRSIIRTKNAKNTRKGSEFEKNDHGNQIDLFFRERSNTYIETFNTVGKCYLSDISDE